MRKLFLAVSVIGFLLFLLELPISADEDGVVRFATLPSSSPGHPEGIAADASGNIYAATFSFAGQNLIHIFSGHNGRLLDTIPLPVAPLFVVPLGLAFDSAGNLYAADFLNGDVLKFTPPFNAFSTPSATFDVCGGVGAGCGLNAITFDASGDLYVSDSFGGNIFKIDLDRRRSRVSVFFTDPLLAPAGFPPFGANGLAFSADGTALYIANTSTDRVLKLDLGTMSVSIFAQNIDGADGIAFDDQGRLWVAANQADEVVAVDGAGQIVDRRGSFEGIDPNGAVKGLLFPASIVLSRGSIFVTNAALVLTPTVGDEPEEGVTTFTVSRIPLGGQ